MKKIAYCLFGIGALYCLWSNSAFADNFRAKIAQLGVDNGYGYEGKAYCEVTFVQETIEGESTHTLYAIPIVEEPAFSSLFTILKYAKERDKTVKIISSVTWTRPDGDGNPNTDNGVVFGRINYAE